MNRLPRTVIRTADLECVSYYRGTPYEQKKTIAALIKMDLRQNSMRLICDYHEWNQEIQLCIWCVLPCPWQSVSLPRPSMAKMEWIPGGPGGCFLRAAWPIGTRKCCLACWVSVIHLKKKSWFTESFQRSPPQTSSLSANVKRSLLKAAATAIPSARTVSWMQCFHLGISLWLPVDPIALLKFSMVSRSSREAAGPIL